MKKVVIGLLSCCAFILSSQAQETRKPTNKMHYQHHQKSLSAERLNLSESQKEQLKASKEVYQKQLEELEKNDNIPVKEYRERKKAIHQEQKEKWNSLLTPEQKSQLEKDRADRKVKHEMKRSQRQADMQSRLNLTNDQMASLKSSREANRAQVNSIRLNEKLTESEKKEQMNSLKEQYKNDLKKVLSEDQLQKMQEYKKQGRKQPNR